MNKLLSFPFIFAISIYQKLISPFFPKCCRFTPTCSEYSLKCFRKYNFFKALLLTTKRVLRCHPFGGQGHDPIP